MCGAFSIRINPWQVREIEDILPSRTWKPIYNARPGEWLPVVTQEEPKTITLAFWTFVPHWAKDKKMKGVINAKAETVAEKPYFRSAFRQHRCIIPADGFYEWQRKGKMSAPYFFHRKDDKPFNFAGLYDPIPGQDKIGFTLITTTPNSLVEKIHDRMPVMLQEGEEDLWLNPKATAPELLPLLDSYPIDLMGSYPVSRKVNYAKEKGPEVLQKAA